MERVNGLSHVRILVPDIDEAIRFYCQGLGLTLKHRDEKEAVIATPDNILLIFRGGGTREGDTSGITHVCYNTFDVDAAFARALEFGAVPSRKSDPVPYTYKNLRMAFVRTKTGEEIEFWGIMRKNGCFGEPMPGNCYVKHFVHVALTVPDMQASIRFYEGIGARLKVDWEWGCSLRLPDMREMELFTGGVSASDPKAYTSFGFLAHTQKEQTALNCLGPAGETIEFAHLEKDCASDVYLTRIPDRLPDLFLEAPEE
jgi:catechol 2,3-dioxygenase-like lactoylglutathione lyase family enzyme